MPIADALPRVSHALIEPHTLDHHTMGRPSLQREVFDSFFARLPEYLRQMRSGLDQNDAEQWRFGAHSIKGTARMLGLARLAEIAARAENAQPEQRALNRVRLACAEAFSAGYGYLRTARQRH